MLSEFSGSIAMLVIARPSNAVASNSVDGIADVLIVATLIVSLQTSFLSLAVETK